jgi:hypothetical protein
MKLYHGTSTKRLDEILKHGLRPRKGRKCKSNWKEYPSRTDMVYLTSAYPFYFAASAAGKGEDPVVFEIDTTLLEEGNFFPDEDFISQGMKDIANHDKYRENLELYQHHWELSVEKLGNCCYKGVIPAKAITRYCILSKKRSDLLIQMLDPSISIMNFMVLGTWYNNFVSYMFGDLELIPDKFGDMKFDNLEDGTEEHKQTMTMFKQLSDQRIEQSKNREGITVKEVHYG